MQRALCSDWFGNFVRGPSFELSLDEYDGEPELAFKVDVPKLAVVSPIDDGSYREGLWNYDCAELFLGNPLTGYYVELNISPRGGWWSCSFASTRVPIEEGPIPLPNIRSEGTLSADEFNPAWSASIFIPLSSLPVELDFSPISTVGNITFCLKDAEEKNSTTFLSLFDLTLEGSNPDFHRPKLWGKLFQ
jgi:hypothetical protein